MAILTGTSTTGAGKAAGKAIWHQHQHLNISGVGNVIVVAVVVAIELGVVKEAKKIHYKN